MLWATVGRTARRRFMQTPSFDTTPAFPTIGSLDAGASIFQTSVFALIAHRSRRTGAFPPTTSRPGWNAESPFNLVHAGRAQRTILGVVTEGHACIETLSASCALWTDPVAATSAHTSVVLGLTVLSSEAVTILTAAPVAFDAAGLSTDQPDTTVSIRITDRLATNIPGWPRIWSPGPNICPLCTRIERDSTVLCANIRAGCPPCIRRQTRIDGFLAARTCRKQRCNKHKTTHVPRPQYA